MARTDATITGNFQKLIASETLEQATKVLAAHRAWIKRRALNSVVPTEEDPERPNSDATSWAVGTAPFQTSHGQNNEDFNLRQVPSENKRNSRTTRSKKLSISHSRVVPTLFGDNLPLKVRPISPEAFISEGSGDVQISSSTHSPPVLVAWGSMSSLGLSKEKSILASEIMDGNGSVTNQGDYQDKVKAEGLATADRGDRVPLSDLTLEQNTPSPKSKGSLVYGATTFSDLSSDHSVKSNREFGIDDRIPCSDLSPEQNDLSSHLNRSLTIADRVDLSPKQNDQSSHLSKSLTMADRVDLPPEQNDQSSHLSRSLTIANKVDLPPKQNDQLFSSSLTSRGNNKSQVKKKRLQSLQANDSVKLVTVRPAPKSKRSSYATHWHSKLSFDTDSEVHSKPRNPKSLMPDSQVTQTHPSGGMKDDSCQDIPEVGVINVLPLYHKSKSNSLFLGRVSSPEHSNQKESFNYPAFEEHLDVTVQNLSIERISDGKTLRDMDILCKHSLKDEDSWAQVHNLVVETDAGREKDLAEKQRKNTLTTNGGESLVGSGHVTNKKSKRDGEESTSTEDPLLPVKSRHTSTSSSRFGGDDKTKLPPLKDLELMDTDSQPSLNMVSPLSPYLTDFSLSGKRARSPPKYEIHRPTGGLALAPPCPMYGEEQQLEDKAVVSSNKRDFEDVESIGRETPQEAASRLNRTSSTLILNDPNSSTEQLLVKERVNSAKKGLLQVDSGEVTVPGVPRIPSSPHLTLSFAGLPPGPSPVHIATKLGNLRRLQSLLNQGYDVDMPDQDGRTPLMYCIQSEGVQLSCADTLIMNGANVNRQASDGSTALHVAASIGAVSLIELLLMSGAKPDLQDFEGRFPIHWATLQKGTKTFAVLLKSNVSLNCTDDTGMTVLMWAAYNNNHTIIPYLTDKGADTEEKDVDGYTAMHWAVHKENSHCLQLLLHPDMTYFKNNEGRTVMHLAAEKGSMNACEVILKLRHDAIHDTDKMGRTPLHYSAVCSRVDITALLLDYGADASHKDSTLRTPLDYAREKKLDYIVALLSCHATAVADFARVSRSTTILDRSISFIQLPLQSTTSPNGSLLSKSLTSFAGLSTPSVANEKGSFLGGSVAADDIDVVKGGYLGRFFPDDQEPVRHYYFRLNQEEGSILWSRSHESSFKNPKKALVHEVHEGPSNTVKNISKFSPDSLHRYTFWVQTAGGVLDMFAYNEDAFRAWLIKLEHVAQRNANLADTAAIQTFKSSSVYERPPSSLSSYSASKTSVVPVDNGEESSDHKMDTSIFTRLNYNESVILSTDTNDCSDRKLTVKSPTSKRTQIIHVANSSGLSEGKLSMVNFVGESYRSHDLSSDHTLSNSDHVTLDDII